MSEYSILKSINQANILTAYSSYIHSNNIVTSMRVRVTKITGSSSDDWIY
jgi:hypothetical protein